MDTQLQTLNGVQTKPVDASDLKDFNEEEQRQILDIAENINIENSQLVLQYGSGTQSKLSTFADNVLDNVRAKDSGYVGSMLTDLMLKVKDMDVDSLSKDTGFFSKLFGGIASSAKKFMARYEKLSVEIEKITEELEKASMELLRDIKMFDNLYEKNLDYLHELNLLIAAGNLKLQEINENIIPALKAQAHASNDPMDAQKLNDILQLATRFEKKLHDLKLSKMIAIQTAPQVRLIQNNNQVLVEKIQSSILNTIPLWKNQIIIAIGLFRQKNALELQKSVTDTTNELLAKNAEMLKQGTIDVAKESERGIVDIETLKKVNADLISTIEETLRIQQEGKEKRKAAELELSKMEDELKAKLIAVKN